MTLSMNGINSESNLCRCTYFSFPLSHHFSRSRCLLCGPQTKTRFMAIKAGWSSPNTKYIMNMYTFEKEAIKEAFGRSRRMRRRRRTSWSSISPQSNANWPTGHIRSNLKPISIAWRSLHSWLYVFHRYPGPFSKTRRQDKIVSLAVSLHLSKNAEEFRDDVGEYFEEWE